MEKDNNGQEQPKKNRNNFGDKWNSNGFANPANKHKAGRPKKNKLTDMIAEDLGERVTPSQIAEVMAMLLNYSQKELYAITDCKDKGKYPFFVCIIAESMLADHKKKTNDTAFKIIERIAGRAPQSVEIRAELVSRPDVSSLDAAQKMELLTLLQKVDAVKDSGGDNS